MHQLQISSSHNIFFNKLYLGRVMDVVLNIVSVHILRNNNLHHAQVKSLSDKQHAKQCKAEDEERCNVSVLQEDVLSAVTK